MYGAKYQWIILGDSSSADWGQRVDQAVSCTEDQLKTAMHGYIATDILPLSSGEEKTESELVSGLRWYDFRSASYALPVINHSLRSAKRAD